ncbi:MAG: nucleotidyltransferase domain-containing protein [Planctomycetes bacterium]|nr:nucleotidyltransferase domain-containing protein [Planctomycetota bacterium]
MNPDPASLEIARSFVRRAASDVRVVEGYLFGSRARGAATEESDFDILLVSPDFEGVKPHKRPVPLFRHWDYSVSGLDLLCFTPEEFSRSRGMLSIVADVLPTAVPLHP